MSRRWPWYNIRMGSLTPPDSAQANATVPAASAGGSAVTHLELDTLLESAPMGILLTQDRRMVRANPLFAEMMRSTLDDLLGQPASMLWPDMETYAELGRQAGPVLASGGRFQARCRHAALMVSCSGAGSPPRR